MFITFEGIDGSGKSTHCKLLHNYLLKNKIDVILLREPGSTRIAEQIRNILLNKQNKEIFDITEVFLFLAARSQLVNEKIKPALDEKKWVICDRYIDSTVAYQAYGRNFKIKDINRLNKIATNGLIPDITFFLDVFNIKKISFKDRIEKKNYRFYQRIYNGYKKIVNENPERIISIDGKKKKNQIKKEILEIINKHLPKNELD